MEDDEDESEVDYGESASQGLSAKLTLFVRDHTYRLILSSTVRYENTALVM